MCVFLCVCVCVWDLIKVCDDVIEEAETSKVLVSSLFLLVVFGEPWQRGEEDTDPLVRLRVEFLWCPDTNTMSTPAHAHTHTHTTADTLGSSYLIIAVPLQEVLGDVGWEDVEQQARVVLPQLPHVLHLLSGL